MILAQVIPMEVNQVSRPTTRREMVFVGLLLVILLGACRRTPEPGPTLVPSATASSIPTISPTSPVSTATPVTPTASPTPVSEATIYPYPASVLPTITPLGGYPPPVGGGTETAYPGPRTPFPSPTSPYPAPPGGAPASPSPSAYPPPGSVATPAPTTRPGYPPPGGTTAVPTIQPGYPYPGAVTPTQLVPGTPGPTPPSAPTQVSSPTPTQGLVRTRLQATDPRTFEIISGQNQLVEFFAFWSPTSRSMAPIMYSLEDRYQDQIRFVYLDIDDPANSLFKSLIGSRMPPLFFLLDGQGNVVKEWSGYVSATEFESAFATLGQ